MVLGLDKFFAGECGVLGSYVVWKMGLICPSLRIVRLQPFPGLLFGYVPKPRRAGSGATSLFYYRFEEGGRALLDNPPFTMWR